MHERGDLIVRWRELVFHHELRIFTAPSKLPQSETNALLIKSLLQNKLCPRGRTGENSPGGSTTFRSSDTEEEISVIALIWRGAILPPGAAKLKKRALNKESESDKLQVWYFEQNCKLPVCILWKPNLNQNYTPVFTRFVPATKIRF